MYDPDTVALISSAPKLEGLDLGDLPRRLTEAYATIVANRVRLRQVSAASSFPHEVQEIVQQVRRIALTNEALVSAAPKREDRKAAAFVAASAHNLWLLAALAMMQGLIVPPLR